MGLCYQISRSGDPIPLATQWKSLLHHVQVLSLEWLLMSCLDDFPEHTMCHLPQEWVIEDGIVVTDFMLIVKKTKLENSVIKWMNNKVGEINLQREIMSQQRTRFNGEKKFIRNLKRICRKEG